MVGGTSAWLLPDPLIPTPRPPRRLLPSAEQPPATDLDDGTTTSGATLDVSLDVPSDAIVGDEVLLVADATVGDLGDSIADLAAIGAALDAYRREHGSYPPAYLADDDGTPLLSWRVLLLPHLGAQDLYDRFDLTAAWDDPANEALVASMPEVYRSADVIPEPDEGLTSYAGVAGTKQVFRNGSTELGGGVPIDAVIDGDSMTIGVAPVGADVSIPWTAPVDVDVDAHRALGDPAGFDGAVDGLTPLLFLDGTVRNVFDDTDGEVVWSWSTIAGDSCSPPTNHEMAPTYAWDLDDDGEPDAFGPSVPFVAEASGTYEVSVQVDDGLGEVQTVRTTVTVA
ncbi:MAG: DUF1559 domain-containing protein [Ilumatobacteraceae bacterium]